MAPEGKIKSKDLSYDSSLPPFLQRLHAQNAGRGDQDRHERPIPRPTRVKAHEDEDEPTVVDESGETVSKAELEKMTSAQNTSPDAEAGGNVTGTLDGEGEAMVSGAIQDTPKSDQKVTDGAAVKKRKVAKVVGGEESPIDAESRGNDDLEKGPVKKFAKKAKKSKPIKLAFDEDDET
jgi:hypothetical protein